jgi:hypothetical protein
MRRAIGFILLAAAVTTATVSAGFFLEDDCEVRGALRVDGSPVTVGAELAAVIGTDEVARTVVSQAGLYALIVHRYDSTKPESRGYRSEDDMITVYVDGRKAEPSIRAESGQRNVDLVVKATPLDVKQTTWGKIKALFK